MAVNKIGERGMVLVMGITGAGKSYFINELKEGSVEIGETMDSCEYSMQSIIRHNNNGKRVLGTVDCEIVETCIGDTDVAVVDCPGFDDSTRSDAEILSIISELVTTQYHIGMKLWGIVFLHRITDIKFQGSTHNVLNLFRQLVGDEALGNVVLATTQWSKVTEKDMPAAIIREQELRDKYWREMLDANSVTTRFNGGKASAEGIIAQLLGKNPIVLKLQRELIDEKKSLGKTGAGMFLKPKIDRKMRESKEELERLRAELKSGRLNNTRMLRIQREITEAEAGIASGESDEARLGKKVGVDLAEKLANVDWQKGLRFALSLVGITFNIVVLVLGGL
jgi:septin family protein